MPAQFITRSMDPDALAPIGDGWTLRGLAAPYEHDQLVTDDGTTHYLERFARHAFENDARKGGRWINLMLGHTGDDGDRFLGRCVGIFEERDGLWLDFRVNRNHPRAEEARSGELRGWSIGARVIRTHTERVGGRERRIRDQAGLNHVAATPSPQYVGAGVVLARGSRTPRLDAARAAFDALRATAPRRGI